MLSDLQLSDAEHALAVPVNTTTLTDAITKQGKQTTQNMTSKQWEVAHEQTRLEQATDEGGRGAGIALARRHAGVPLVQPELQRSQTQQSMMRPGQ